MAARTAREPLGESELVLVTRCKDGWIVRVGQDWEVVGRKEDVTLSIRAQLRMYDKCGLGPPSKMAAASRTRDAAKPRDRLKAYKVLRRGHGSCQKPTA